MSGGRSVPRFDCVKVKKSLAVRGDLRTAGWQGAERSVSVAVFCKLAAILLPLWIAKTAALPMFMCLWQPD